MTKQKKKNPSVLKKVSWVKGKAFWALIIGTLLVGTIMVAGQYLVDGFLKDIFKAAMEGIK